jgi:hypothetical protein
VPEVAATLKVTPGRVAAYVHRARLKMRWLKASVLYATGETKAEVKSLGREYERHGFAPVTRIYRAKNGGRFLYQLWEKRDGEKKAD